MPEASGSVRAFPYPALTEGSLSFPEGEYVPRVRPDASGHAAHIEHKIEKAPFISTVVQEGKAVCSCAVSIPITGYRRAFLNLLGGFSQKIEWDEDVVGQPPILQPFVVMREEMEHKFTEEDGVHEMWVGEVVTLHKGAKIAVGETLRLTSAMESLLSIEKNEDIDDPTQMRVMACADSGFYFKVQVKPELYEFLQSPGEGDRHLHRNSILIHAVSCCLAILARDYANNDVDEDSWKSFQNLKILYADLEHRGIKTWDDEDFFPEEAATAMWPHIIPSEELDDV